MSGRVASREFKAEVHADGVLDLDTLASAVDELKGALDVPGNAKLHINTQTRDGGRWSIAALWDPAKDVRPQEAHGVRVEPGGIVIHPDPEWDPEAAARAIQRQRRVQDNPQA